MICLCDSNQIYKNWNGVFPILRGDGPGQLLAMLMPGLSGPSHIHFFSSQRPSLRGHYQKQSESYPFVNIISYFN